MVSKYLTLVGLNPALKNKLWRRPNKGQHWISSFSKNHLQEQRNRNPLGPFSAVPSSFKFTWQLYSTTFFPKIFCSSRFEIKLRQNKLDTYKRAQKFQEAKPVSDPDSPGCSQLSAKQPEDVQPCDGRRVHPDQGRASPQQPGSDGGDDEPVQVGGAKEVQAVRRSAAAKGQNGRQLADGRRRIDELRREHSEQVQIKKNSSHTVISCQMCCMMDDWISGLVNRFLDKALLMLMRSVSKISLTLRVPQKCDWVY